MYRIDALGAIVRLWVDADATGIPLPPNTIIRELHENLKGLNNHVTLVTAVSTSGNVLWSTNGIPPKPVNLSDREHIQGLLRHGFTHYIGPPVIGRISGERTIQFSSLAKYQGRPLGISVVSVVAESLITALRETLGSDDYEITLKRSDGLYLAGDRSDSQIAEGLIETVMIEFGSRQSSADKNIGLSVSIRRKPAALSADAQNKLAAVRSLALVGIVMSICLTAGLILLLRLRDVAEENRIQRNTSARVDEVVRELDDLLVLAEISEDLQTFTMIYVSASAVHYTGFTPAELERLSKPIEVEDPAGSTNLERMRALIEHGRLGPIRLKMKRKDGTSLWVEQNLKLIGKARHGRGGYRMISRMIDLTSRDLVQKALYRETIRLRSMLDAADACICEISGSVIEGQITNDVWSVPVVPVQPLPARLATIVLQLAFDPRHTNSRNAAIARAVANRRSTWDFSFLSDENTKIYVRIILVCLVNDPNNFKITGLCLDVTAEIEAHAALQEAQRLAEIGRVTAMIAHDLNNPLSAIGLNAELIEANLPAIPELAKPMKQRVDRIQQLVKRGGQIVQNVLQLSRPTFGQVEAFSAQSALVNVMTLFDERPSRGRVRLVVDMPTATITLFGNQVAFERMIVNLVSNGFDAYTPDSAGSSSQRVSVKMTHDTENQTAIISVSDQAGGIPDDVLPHICKPFFTTKPTGKGTGLGLAVSARVCEMMGGTLSAGNADGGAMFTAKLPLRPVSQNTTDCNRVA